jgi:hypothetical protein
LSYEQGPLAEKAFDLGHDVTKQLVTLATAIVALTITFIHDLAANAWATAIHFVEGAWLAYLVSIPFGIMTLLQLAGNLETEAKPSIYRGGILIASRIQIACFVLATALTTVFGMKAHHNTPR